MNLDELKSLTPFELKEKFYKACQNDLPLVKNILENFDIQADSDESIGLRTAVIYQRLDIVKFLLTAPNIKNANINDSNSAALNCACLLGNLEIVRYLLTSDELKEKAWIHGYVSDLLKDHPISVKHLDMPFTNACSGGCIEVVDFLLVSPELDEHCSIYAQNNLGFRNACKEGRIKVVEYLLEFPGFNQSENYEKSLYEGVLVSFNEGHKEITQRLLEITTINDEGKYNLEAIKTILDIDKAQELISLITNTRLQKDLGDKKSVGLKKI